MLIIFLVVTNTIVEKPINSEMQNTFDSNITNEGKVVEQSTDTFDNFFKDFETEEQDNDKCESATTESSIQHTVQPIQSQNTKQSLFIRLANRIKVIYFILKSNFKYILLFNYLLSYRT